jgi:cyclophilin family peptidyl-prolyl cis-trans isomerase
MLRAFCLMVATLVLVGCRGEQAIESKPPAPPKVEKPAREKPATPAGPIRVELTTDKGMIELELDPSAAPKTVESFVRLVKEGFYDGMPFHRVEPGFVIQAGDPALVGRPPVGFTIPDEVSPIRHLRGVIAMARLYRGGQMVPNSASTQFYITLGDAPHLDKMGFTAFGRVVKGMEVADKIAVGDKIVKARVVG